MVGESKILTVSYGTFSCTLEGFDDPFSTMKAIAEYFRDLAAGDRFFGAEPPQPDTEMLHRIAEQTIQSRVNAEVTDNSLILRQDHSQPKAAPAPLEAVAQVERTPEPAPTAAFDTAAPAPVVSEPVTPAPSSFSDSESIAAKLQRIRAVVSRETAEPAEVTSFYSEDEHADEFASDAPASAPAPSDIYEDEEEAAAPEAVGEVAEAPEVAEVAEVAEAPAEETQEAMPETAQDAPSSEPESDADAQEPADELDTADLIAKLGTDAQSDDSPEETAETDASSDADAPVETFEDQADAAEEMVEDDSSDIIADAEGAPEPQAELAEDDTANEDAVSALLASTEAPEDDADTAPSLAKPRRRIIVQKVSRAEVEAAQSSDSVPETAEDDAEPSAELDAEAEAALMRELAAVEADMEPQSSDVAELPQAEDVARDVTEDDAAEDASESDGIDTRALAAALGVQDDVQDEADTDAEAVAQDTASQAEVDADAKALEEADALAKVMAEAADIEAELNGTEVTPDTAEETDAVNAQDETRASRIARRSAMVEDEDAALNRLMDATSTRLSDDDEGAVRRASIAHLKAAVAATKADDSIAQAAADEEERELDQYRSDLARVVRPGRARPRAEGTSTSRPSPLVLVSEQRIDAPELDGAAAAAALDVRPRRITSGNLALQEELEDENDEHLFEQPDVESFGEYAARYAALELPDLLEAAAAHYTFAEGTPSFTRPMLMRKISAITVTDAPSREAGLRSFGSLLREGKIVKGDDGKFVISGKSRFTPEAQEAGA